ncbi:formyl transferase [Hymenobacter lapidiphilus]|uniref:formyltransferase family protein n=1 Tax=Hymenobacter sp. CCM 8763 TaxID=2303334 RepID=UPI000E353350|nr:formyltransferase family protein [Hymenobacter sp. CCM 8763]RFP65519.1 formyl transferase [Hymenobacter sp. CCM 8763]
MKSVRIVFLISGNGGTLKVVHQANQRLQLGLDIVAVLADRPCGGLDYARSVGLPAKQLAYTRKSPFALREALLEAAPDFVVTNIHKIIDAETLALLPPGSFINLHYSLLPAFKGVIGMETVAQAKALNLSIIGATCHEVEEEVDNGRCLAQFALGVDWQRDTLEEVYELVFRGAGLVLLQGLLTQAGREPLPLISAANWPHSILFSPRLCFNSSQLDEAFWQEIKGLGTVQPAVE